MTCANCADKFKKGDLVSGWGGTVRYVVLGTAEEVDLVELVVISAPPHEYQGGRSLGILLQQRLMTSHLWRAPWSGKELQTMKPPR